MSLMTLLEAARYIEQQEQSNSEPEYREEEPCGVLVQQIHNHQTQQHSHHEQQPPVTPVLRNGLTALSVTTANHINLHSAAVINPQHSLSSSLVNTNNVVSGSRAPPPSAPISIPPPHHAAPSPAPLHLLDHHDQPRARSNSNGSGGRSAGTREVHNKLEKNRRAHLKECFELLKKHLPQSTEEKKSSNLSILDNAIKYIQVLKRREKDCEHELEKLARQKIASQQRLASLRSGTSPITPTLHLHSNHDRDAMSEGDEPMMASRRSPLLMTSPRSTSSLSMSLPEHSSNGVLPSSPPSSLDLSTRQLRPPHHSIQPLQVLTNQQATTTMYIEQTSSPPHTRLQQQPSSNSIITTQQIISSPFQQSPHIVNSIVATPGTLNLTVNPSIKATRGPAKAVVAPGLPTLTVTTVNHGPVMAVNPTNVQTRQPVQNVDRKILTTVASPVNGQTAIVHPAQLHLPISQVVNGSGLVMSPTIQMIYATPQTLRMLQGQGGTVAPVDLPNSAANNSVVHQLREVQKVGESGMSAVPFSSSGLINGRTTQHHATNNGNHHHSQQPQHITVKTEGAKGTLHTINPQTQIMMNGLTPLLMSKGGTHIITAPQHLAGKMVSTPILKAVNAQYLGTAGGVKPVVVVSTGNGLQTQQMVPSSTTVPSPSSNS